MYVIERSTLPRYAPVSGLGAVGRCAAASGVNPMAFLASPALATAKMIKNPSPVCGLGADIESPVVASSTTAAAAGVGAIGIAFVAGVLVLSGWLSYQAGKAMAPRPASRKAWGWTGVPVGMLTGGFGLGIMGAVSNHSKG